MKTRLFLVDYQVYFSQHGHTEKINMVMFYELLPFLTLLKAFLNDVTSIKSEVKVQITPPLD